jgi:virginiamycin A acetyltransferase
MHGPDPNEPHPLPGEGGKRLGFLKAFVTNPLIEVGDFTYYDDPKGPAEFERNVLYHFDFIGDRLRIGKFCAIAAGATFLMNGGNHRHDGFSTYPFAIFENGWNGRYPGETEFPFKGDTIVGNDVWIGFEALFMPGVRIGDGAIIASRSVVTADVEPYSIVGGNPAREIRKRFDASTIAALCDIAWWDWDVEKTTRNIPAIAGCDLEALRRAR